MSKKGAYIYQQIAQTTAEWANDTNIYPANVLLFEILEDGKFKMRMSDGVHKFAELPYILTNCDAKVVTDTAEEYRIEFSTPWEKFTTPNLRGPQGDTGLTGKGLAYKWDGTKLSVGSIPEGGSDIEWSDPVDLKGITGQGTDYAWEGTSLKLGTIPAGGSETNWGEPVDLKGDKGEKGDTGTVGIMLDSEPTEDTLTYIVGDVTYNFELGMSAIYPDSESDNGYGLSFFMGVTSEGKAIWGKGGGGAGSLNETVMISLVSNQDEAAIPDADLLGKSVHVIYGDQDKELVWQGEVMKTTVPMNMTYQVVFPSDDRYKCPAQQEYIALAGETREVKGLYYTEAVTVNVTCDDGTSAEGQQVTINGTVYDVDATGSVTAKIPFDVEYTVSVNTKSGYTSPSSVTETANSKTKTISMEYILIVYGVFIEATDGTLHQSTEWTGAKTANSIVVKQPTVAFRIALTQSSNTMQIHSSYSGTLENYMTAIGDSSQAKLDMKSAENTANIMKLQSGTGYAAGYCNSFTFPDGKTKGLLPALGWLQTAYDNKAAVDACLAACGATAMDTSNYHWASTFWGVGSYYRYCWLLRWSDGGVGNYNLSLSCRVRPFAAY